jgi:hypothetical protein
MKCHRLVGLKDTNLFLTVQEVRCPRSRFCRNGFLVRTLFLSCSWQPLHWLLCGQMTERLFMRELLLLTYIWLGSYPHHYLIILITSTKALSPHTATLDVKHNSLHNTGHIAIHSEALEEFDLYQETRLTREPSSSSLPLCLHSSYHTHLPRC